jgi:hypothetical protein
MQPAGEVTAMINWLLGCDREMQNNGDDDWDWPLAPSVAKHISLGARPG